MKYCVKVRFSIIVCIKVCDRIRPEMSIPNPYSLKQEIAKSGNGSGEVKYPKNRRKIKDSENIQFMEIG
jgi:hypothetical protein